MTRVVSLFLPTWSDRPAAAEGWATPRLRLRRRWSWSAGTEDGGWCWRPMPPRGRGPARRHAGHQGAGAGARPRRSRMPTRRRMPKRSNGWRSGRCSATRRSSPPIRRTGIVIDVTGADHLHGGEAGHARRAGRAADRVRHRRPRRRRRQLGRRSCARPLCARGRPSSSPPGHGAAVLAPLPIAALRLPRDDGRRTCASLGFERIGDLLAQPRAPLALRFGPELGRRLDQAIGAAGRADRAGACRPTCIEVRRAFAEPIGAAETHRPLHRQAGRAALRGAGGQGPRRPAARSAVATASTTGIEAIRVGTAQAGARRQAPDPAALRPDRDHRSRLRHRGDDARRDRRRAARAAGRPPSSLVEEPEAGCLRPRSIPSPTGSASERLYRFAPVASDVPERSVARGRAAGAGHRRRLARPLAAAGAPAADAGADRDRGAAARSSARVLHLARRPPAREARRRARAGLRRVVEARRRAGRGAGLFPGRGRGRRALLDLSAPATARMPATGSQRWFLHGVFG